MDGVLSNNLDFYKTEFTRATFGVLIKCEEDFCQKNLL